MNKYGCEQEDVQEQCGNTYSRECGEMQEKGGGGNMYRREFEMQEQDQERNGYLSEK